VAVVTAVIAVLREQVLALVLRLRTLDQPRLADRRAQLRRLRAASTPSWPARAAPPA